MLTSSVSTSVYFFVLWFVINTEKSVHDLCNSPEFQEFLISLDSVTLEIPPVQTEALIWAHPDLRNSIEFYFDKALSQLPCFSLFPSLFPSPILLFLYNIINPFASLSSTFSFLILFPANPSSSCSCSRSVSCLCSFLILGLSSSCRYLLSCSLHRLQLSEHTNCCRAWTCSSPFRACTRCLQGTSNKGHAYLWKALGKHAVQLEPSSLR